MSLKLLLLSVAAEMMGLLPRFAADDALRKTGLWNQNTQSYNKKISYKNIFHDYIIIPMLSKGSKIPF